MHQFLVKELPNVMTKLPELKDCIIQTLVMISISGIIAFILGMIIGIVLIATKKGGVFENKIVFNIVDKIINIVRSIPFIILLTAAIPLSRLIVGTAIGTKGAIVPLILGTVPFFSRQVESALSEVDDGVIEAAKSMGTGPFGVIFRVYLRESIPSITRVTTITFISLIGLTAMAGAIGGGGLGDFAIRYGYQRYQHDVTCITILILLLLVSIIQFFGNLIIKQTTH